jgi:ribosomal protein S18 acetylase RimI-like enzyme
VSEESGQASQPQLFMRQPDLSGLPAAPPLEPGYVLRKAVPADHEQLAGLLSEAYGDSWDVRRVAGEFSSGNGVEATYVVAAPTGVVATAAARRLPRRYPDAGYVHYVGARSSERGKRLGEVVTRRVLAHFAAEGLQQAVLETDDFRLPAIWIYLRLGFVPEPRMPGDVVRWSAVLRDLAAGPQRRTPAADASAAHTAPTAQAAPAAGARS